MSLNHSCSCSSQGPRTLFSHTCASRRVPESVLFTPKHSLTAKNRAKKNILHHKSRYADKPFSRTHHTSGVICISHLEACALWIVPLNYTHKRHSHKNVNTQTHTVNTTNVFSSTNNNIPHIQTLIK